MRLFVELLRERVGSPVSLASITRDLAVSPTTLKSYLDILQALHIVFTAQPWRRNVARAILQTPKVYFFDMGLVRGNEGERLENAVAAMLLKHVHFLQDSRVQPAGLHYIRTKDDAEVDLALSNDKDLTHLIECKLSDNTPPSLSGRLCRQISVGLGDSTRSRFAAGRVPIGDTHHRCRALASRAGCLRISRERLPSRINDNLNRGADSQTV